MERSYRKLFWILALSGLLLDQVTKYGVFAWLSTAEDHSYSVVHNVFEFVAPSRMVEGKLVPAVNHGALFGLAQEYEGVSNSIFAIISCLAAIAIVYWSYQSSTA